MKSLFKLLKERKFKKSFKRLYFFFTKLPYRLERLKWWFLHRTFYKYNRIKIPSLTPGYYDTDTVMLHGCFDLLVNFVEGELAWMHLSTSSTERSKIPWWMPTRFYWKKHAQRLGLAYLDWEMTLTVEHTDQGENVPGSNLQINIEDTQGWCAKEKKELYLWWKNHLDEYDKLTSSDDYTFKDEISYFEQENKQLIRLMKVRRSLWT